MLIELGSEDTLSISSAMKILSKLQRSCGYRRLNTNELHVEILRFLCNEAIEQQTSNRPIWESELVVPDDSCRLVHAYLSVYIDSSGSQYVKFIDSSKLRFVHHYVSERLCSAFGIRKLSDIVVEDQRNTKLEHGGVPAAELVQAVEEMLSVAGAACRKSQRLATKEVGAAKAALQCQICLTNAIDIILVSCGHGLCGPCSSEVSYPIL